MNWKKKLFLIAFISSAIVAVNQIFIVAEPLIEDSTFDMSELRKLAAFSIMALGSYFAYKKEKNKVEEKI